MTQTEVLLVEDNQHDAELTLRAFTKQNLGNKIYIAKDGEEALEFINTNDVSSHLKVIFLDLKLPKINGIEFLERIRKQQKTKNVPVVIVTSSQEPRDLIQCYVLGANSYVVKPVDYESFMAIFSELGAYWLQINKTIGDN